MSKRTYRKILSIILCLTIIISSVISYIEYNKNNVAYGAEVVTMQTVDEMKDIYVVSSDGRTEYHNPIKKTTTGEYAYCVEEKKERPSSSGNEYSLSMLMSNPTNVIGYDEITKRGLNCIIQNGFPNNETFYGTSNYRESYWATSMAIHLWLTHQGFDEATKNRSVYFTRFDFNKLDEFISKGDTIELHPANEGSKRALIACCYLLKDAVNNNEKESELFVSIQSATIEGNNYVVKYNVNINNIERWEVRNISSSLIIDKTSGNNNDIITVKVPINTITQKNSFGINVYGINNGPKTINNFYTAEPINNSSIQTMLSYRQVPYDVKDFKSAEFTVPALGKIKIIKLDASTNATLSGAIFGLYSDASCSEASKIAIGTSDNNGEVFFNDLVPGNYYVKEIQAPEGYLLNGINNNAVTVSVSSDNVTSVTFKDNYATGEIELTKVDSETNDKLQGAVFELYAREDILSPDKRTVLYSKGSLVNTFAATNSEGTTSLSVPLGNYYIIETVAPNGYYKNSNPINVDVLYANQKVPVVLNETTVSNDYQYGKIILTKTDNETNRTLEGAIFELYARENIVSPSNENVVLYEKDSLILTTEPTDSNGIVIIDKLHLGKYYLKEVKSPNGYRLSDDIVEYDFEYVGGDVQYIPISTTYTNEELRNRIKVVKKDAETGNIVKVAGAKFEIRDISTNNLIETITTDSNGVATSGVIKYGNSGGYIVTEVEAPYGYNVNPNPVYVNITEETDKNEFIEIEICDTSIKGYLKLLKTGEVLTGYTEGSFTYSEASLSNVTFDVFAKEDIYSADRNNLVYAKDSYIETITTDIDGIAKTSLLPLGNYYVIETSAPEGYTFTDIKYDFSIKSDSEMNETDEYGNLIVIDTISVYNKLQDYKISVYKTDSETQQPLKGVEFSLVANKNIYSIGGLLLVTKGTVLETGVTDENGRYEFVTDLPTSAYACGVDSYITATETEEMIEEYSEHEPTEEDIEEIEISDDTEDLGMYMIQETKGLSNYYTKNECQYVDGKADGNTTEVSIQLNYENDITKVYISKKDITTQDELPGVTLRITDSNNNIVEEWVSKEEPTLITGLNIGEEYTLTEVKAIDGYLIAEDVKFTILDDKNTINTVVMYDDYTKIEVKKIDTNEIAVKGAKLALYDANGNEVINWITDETGTYKIDRLPVGTYILKEIEAPKGYSLAEDKEIIVEEDGKLQSYTMVDEIGIEILYPDIPTSPQTGDTNYMALYITVILLLGAIVLGIHILKKKK